MRAVHVRVVRYFVLKFVSWACLSGNSSLRLGYEPHTKTKTIFIAVQTFIAVQIFFSTLKPRLVEHTADVYCRTDFYCGTDGTVFWGGKYKLETRFARIIRYEYSLYILQSRASRSRCSIPGISGRVDMLTSPVPAARAAVATRAWVESKHDMYLIHTWK